jgi:predicted nuclease with TOPRIM domain
MHTPRFYPINNPAKLIKVRSEHSRINEHAERIAGEVHRLKAGYQDPEFCLDGGR